MSEKLIDRHRKSTQYLLQNPMNLQKLTQIYLQTKTIELTIDRLRPKIPPKFNYYPLNDSKTGLKKNPNLEEIQEWFDRPEIRVNLLNFLELSFISNYLYPSYQNQNYLDSPYFQEYLSFLESQVIPRYYQLMKEKKIQIDSTEGDFLKKMIYAALGYLIPTSKDYHLIFHEFFSTAKIVKVPAIGNCYFCSIGQHVDKSQQEVRKDLSQALAKLPRDDFEDLVIVSFQNCPRDSKYYLELKQNREQFMNNYLELLEKSCHPGDRDCYECIWGGNHYDPFLADLYHAPVISYLLMNQMELTEAILNGEEDPKFIKVLEELKLLRRREIPGEDFNGEESYVEVRKSDIQIIVNYTVPSQWFDQKEEYLKNHRGRLITYLTQAGRAHIDSVIF